MRACFIRHRKININTKLVVSLKQTIIALIDKGVKTFLFGSISEFDDLSWKTVTALKNKYPFIKRVYVRAAYQCIDKSYEDYLLKSYEETYYPAKLEKAGKFSYVERNYEMIDNSTYCIFYYNKNYTPTLRLQSNFSFSSHTKHNSGTRTAYHYAVKKKKTIINLYI